MMSGVFIYLLETNQLTLGVCDMTILKKYSIVLQCKFFQLQFWCLNINKLYNETYIHISVNTAVELLSGALH